MGEWINVKDRLPPNNNEVLIFNPIDGIEIGDYEYRNVETYLEADGSTGIIDDGGCSDYSLSPRERPTHWMPLPKEPTLIAP